MCVCMYVCVCVCVYEQKYAFVHVTDTVSMLQGLRANWSSLLLAIQRTRNETENQILIRDSKGLTEEQIREYRQSFDHFDRVRAVVTVTLIQNVINMVLFVSTLPLLLHYFSLPLPVFLYQSCSCSTPIAG